MGNYNKLLMIIISLFLIPIAFSVDFDFTTEHNHNCSGRSYETNSNYSQSLLYLVDNLQFKASTSNGFGNASWAQDPSNTAYGLALCRGDLSPESCDKCLTNATIKVVNTDCPNSRGAIILNDYCMLKYSDVDFLGQVDDSIYYYDTNSDNYLNITNHEVVQWLNNLSQTAINAKPPQKFFANGTMKTGDNIFPTLYGMVQCTGDLSKGNCIDCINNCTKYILAPGLSNTLERGAQMIKGSCRVRYETYPFLV